MRFTKRQWREIGDYSNYHKKSFVSKNRITNNQNYTIMKTIAIRSNKSESIIIIKVDDELKNVIKKGKEVSIFLKGQEFNEGAILKIPFHSDSIIPYTLGTIYKSRFARDENICEPNFIEYLNLGEQERIDFANEHGIATDWFVSDIGIDLTNYSVDGIVTSILFENELINISCTDNSDGEIMSETIPCDILL